MPDILIRMEMPVEQPVTLILDPSGRVWLPDIKTNKEYMARELPPHGDLIDVSKVVLEYGGLAKISPHDFVGIAKYFSEQIEGQPVVVPAERSGE